MLQVEGQRHIILALPEQLSILQKAKRWYADGTFKLVRDPFVQLWSVHAFVREGDSSKQLPLVFCLMSRRKKADYRAVLRAILEILPGPPAIKELMMDFERAAWKATQKVLPDVRIQGCAFHWGQAVFRKTQELGLQTAYSQDVGTHKLVRRLLALPLLPAAHIETVFNKLREKAVDNEQLQSLTTYMYKTWISSSVWPPANWSVFGQEVRTNNDTEGWHTRLRSNGKPNMPFYLLVKVLHEESETVDLTVQLVSDNKVSRRQRKQYKNIQNRLNEAWDEYTASRQTTKKAMRLLRAVAGIYGGPV